MTVSNQSIEVIKEKFHTFFTEKEWDFINRWRSEAINLISGKAPENERQENFLRVIEGEIPPSSNFEIAWSKIARISELLDSEINLRERMSHFNQLSNELQRELRKVRSENQHSIEDLKAKLENKSSELLREINSLAAKLSDSRAESNRLHQRSKLLQAELKNSWLAIYDGGIDYIPQPEFATMHAETITRSILECASEIDLRDIKTILTLDRFNISNADFASLLERARTLETPIEQMRAIEQECLERGIPTDLPVKISTPSDLLSNCQACGRPTRYCQC